MEELTPELERRIQVEELWGRRIVLEESKNAWRFREYQSRRLLCLLRGEETEGRAVARAPSVSRPKMAQPARNATVFSLRRSAVLAGIALFAGLVAQADGKFSAWHGNANIAKTTMASDQSKARTQARPGSGQESWYRPAEMHASKLRPLDADLKRIFGSSL
jgi:hypothetical protein